MTHALRFARIMLLALAALSTFAPSSVRAVEPSIRSVDIRGLTIGGTTTLVIDGDDLGSVASTDPKDPKKKTIGPGPKLMLPFAAKQELKSGATEKRAVFDVTLADDIAPGYYNLRVTTDGGVSLPVVVAVDRLVQQTFPPAKPATPPKSGEAASPPIALPLPIALHGVASSSTVLEASFAGKAGQPLTVEIESQRLGGKLRPVIHLYDPTRRQIAWSWPTPTLSGDTQLTTVLPTDGAYTVAVHDLEYAAPTNSFFRLRLGGRASAERVFPPVVMPSDKRPTELVEHEAGASAKPQVLPAGPVGISGRLLKPYEEDRFRIATTPGAKLRFEVFAERIGSSIDAALVVRDDKGTQLARGEDGPQTIDPTLDYVVPDQTAAITVGVIDTQGRGSSDAAYRLVVEPTINGQTGGPGDFRLSTVTQRLSLPAGGSAVVPIVAERRGYLGEIELAAKSLPAGLKLAATKIPAEADGALIVVERTGPLADAVIAELQGKGNGAMTRPVILKGHPAERLQPWLASEFALAATTQKADDLKIEWRGLPADVRLVPGKNLPLPIKATRTDDKLPIRLSLITSQLPPITGNNQPDLPKTLRAEKPIELAAKTADGEVVAVVPPELANSSYDVAIQAELLSADKRTVLATSFTPVKRLELSLPVAVKLAGPSDLKVALDPKTNATLKITGKIERREGATGDAVVSLTGLPPTLNAAPATVKTGTDDFTLTVALPPTTTPAVLSGLKLSALITPDPKAPAVRVKSRDVELTLTIAAAPAPMPAAPAPAKK